MEMPFMKPKPAVQGSSNVQALDSTSNMDNSEQAQNDAKFKKGMGVYSMISQGTKGGGGGMMQPYEMRR